MFDAPLDAEPSWPALYPVLRDRSRNMLFNYLGAREDEVPMALRPDCADLVYFLRAYFAFKMGLPFGYSNCSRGGGGHPPRCVGWTNVANAGPAAGGLGPAFGVICTSSPTPCSPARCGRSANDENTDFYTVPLSQQTLRPGTVYADPYGQ